MKNTNTNYEINYKDTIFEKMFQYLIMIIIPNIYTNL